MNDIDQLSPDDQLHGFARRPLLPMLLLALIVHALVIGGTSVGYVMALLNPEEEAAAVVEQTDDETATDEPSESEVDSTAADSDAAESSVSQSDESVTKSSNPELEAIRNDPKAVNEAYVEETFGATEEVPEDLDNLEGLLDFGD